MSTKGASNRYKNTKGSSQQDKTESRVNYEWAKKFNKSGLQRHFENHGKEFNCGTKEEYAAKALKFANTIDRKNCKSAVDKNGTTYKYNKKTNEFVEVTKDGYVISYRHYGKKVWYITKKGKKKWKK